MSAAVHGEITADGQSVAVIAAGNDWDVDAAARALKHMTPAFKGSDPPGALVTPLSWPLVVQLAWTFDGKGEHGSWHPGPRLAEWTREQAFRRAHGSQTTNASQRAHEINGSHIPADSQGSDAHSQTRCDSQRVTDPGSRAGTDSPGSIADPRSHSSADSQSANACQGTPEINRSRTAFASQGHHVPDDTSCSRYCSDSHGGDALILPVTWNLPDAPRRYQVDGAISIASAGKFLLLDEPGCGKTATAVLGLRLQQDVNEQDIYPLVIVVPAWEVADSWAREIARWAPQWPSPVLYSGPGRMRHLDAEILITTYATARIDAPSAEGPLVKLGARSVVLDEFHFIRNQDAKRSQAARRIASRAGTVIGLSGTPVTRDTGDIWAPLAAMDPGAWPSRDRFVKRFCERADTEYGERIEGLKQNAETEFRTCLLGSVRRVAKADVLDQLPPKIYSVRRVQVPPEWRRAYDTMQEQMLAELPDGSELPVMHTLAQLGRLIQLASSAADVQEEAYLDEVTGEEKTRYRVTLKAPSWKADALVRVLQERPGQQVVCFAPSSQLVMVAAAAAEEAGCRTGLLTGDQARGARKTSLADFAAGKLDLICATTGAGGTGINELAVAGTAVFLQRDWALENNIQPEDRLHRPGQVHDCVEIIDIVAADTVDERVRSKLRDKAGQFAEFVKDPRIVRELLGGAR